VSEGLAVRFGDIDLAAETWTVAGQLADDGTVRATKTPGSMATVPLSQAAVAIVKEQRAALMGRSFAAAAADAFVFVGLDAQPLRRPQRAGRVAARDQCDPRRLPAAARPPDDVPVAARRERHRRRHGTGARAPREAIHDSGHLHAGSRRRQRGGWSGCAQRWRRGESCHRVATDGGSSLWRGFPSGLPLSRNQEDHLISLELGGNPTDARNLWPEPYPRAAEVDRIENELNAEVCSGRLTLAEAQQREDDLKHRDG
jgi:hypothetical protein